MFRARSLCIIADADARAETSKAVA